ncbi:DeoR/GlpR family DNA-binding transcription regulator [Nesterenkonia halophila]|uniref:DeoR/GlpR family DNA-binding transcription regulator n=1 Tax=Nesterenkonia halophila TaxID=302044 RepID=UPI001478A5A6|nr:DeoR/GlpR family DNA-binding transcription regulator [Nesterenkonia halophila]
MDNTGDLAPRQREIVQRLNERGFVSTSQLAEIFGVSDMTIRRDARTLERVGAASIVHGGLMLPHGTIHTGGFAERARHNFAAKKRIAAACLELLDNRQRVVIDAGTTAFEVAYALPKTFEGTIITHSAPVFQLALRLPAATTISLGGELLQDSQAFIGELAESNLRRLRAEVAIIGTAAMNEHGIYIERNLELSTKLALMDAADQRVLVVTHDKMGSSELVYLCGLDRIDIVVTDADPPEKMATALHDHGVRTIVAH